MMEMWPLMVEFLKVVGMLAIGAALGFVLGVALAASAAAGRGENDGRKR